MRSHKQVRVLLIRFVQIGQREETLIIAIYDRKEILIMSDKKVFNYVHDMGYIDDIAIPVNNNGKVVGADFDAESWDIWTNLTGYELYEIYTDVIGEDSEIVKQMIINELKHRIQDDVWNGTDSKDSIANKEWEITLRKIQWDIYDILSTPSK